MSLLALAAVFSVSMFVNTLLPYNPVTVGTYRVLPERVCTGEPVTATITRAYTEEFGELKLYEAWVQINPQTGRPQRTVASYQGVIPDEATHPTDGFEKVRSPLLTRAPDLPGVYIVEVRAEWHGNRFGFGVFPATGTESFRSSGRIVVEQCNEEGNQ